MPAEKGAPVPPEGETTGEEQALVVLTPAESKRLIAKAVAALPIVRKALKSGRVAIAGGTTNAFVAEEILGRRLESKASYTAGIVTDGICCVTPSEGRVPPFFLENGVPQDVRLRDFIEGFTKDDVFIKGANAVDMQGNIGILAAGSDGGTIGTAWARITAVGAHFIAPVGLEKFVPSVPEAARLTGQGRWKYAMGSPVTLFAIATAKVLTEVEAFCILAGVRAVPTAAGGVGGSEGAVILTLTGSADAVEKAYRLAESVKGEPPVVSRRRACTPDCPYPCSKKPQQ